LRVETSLVFQQCFLRILTRKEVYPVGKQLTRFGVELRTELQKGGSVLAGHASVFGQYADLGNHLEEIGATAFKRALDSNSTDVRALFNHDPSMLLGRQSSGTLRLGTDSQGLEFEVDLPDTSAGRDVKILAERGDLNGASFGFIPDESEWDEVQGRKLLRHTSVKQLVDVSPVTFPAYGGAAVAMRSMQFVEKGEAALLRSQLIRMRHNARYGR
jgi:uncharacterized protein